MHETRAATLMQPPWCHLDRWGQILMETQVLKVLEPQNMTLKLPWVGMRGAFAGLWWSWLVVKLMKAHVNVALLKSLRSSYYLGRLCLAVGQECLFQGVSGSIWGNTSGDGSLKWEVEKEQRQLQWRGSQPHATRCNISCHEPSWQLDPPVS